MVELKGLSAGYGGAAVIKDVTLRFPPGRITALIGPNGSGKSTLLKAVIGLNRRMGGEVLLGGALASSLSAAEAAKRVAYLPQERTTPDMTVFKLALHGRFCHTGYPRRYSPADYEAAQRALERMGIAELAGEYLASLSGGTRQKAYIAAALAQGSPALLLDEPAAHLDAAFQLELLQIARELAEEGKAVAMAIHDLDMALGCADAVALLQRGRLVMSGEPEQLYQSGSIERVFGVKLERLQAADGLHYICRRERTVES